MLRYGSDGSVHPGSRRFGGPIQFRGIWPVVREDLLRVAQPFDEDGVRAGPAAGGPVEADARTGKPQQAA
jgi:hypothetical protein